MHSIGIHYLLLLCCSFGFSTHPHPLPRSFLVFESWLKVIHFSRDLFVCRAPKLYWIASGYLCWWNCACVSRLMQNTAFNIDAWSCSSDVTRPVISSISSWASHSFHSAGLHEFGWAPQTRHTFQFPKHLKTACRLLKISPTGVVQSYRTFLLTSVGFVSNPSKHQSNSGT